VNNSKHTMHKSCSCSMCKRGRGSSFGQEVRRANERKLRRLAKEALRRDPENAEVAPISSPYTD
jgi:hypothetical protein